MGDRLRAGIPPRYVTGPTRSTQPCIPPGSINRVPALIGWDKGRNITSAGWQVTLSDRIWHVSSRSSEALANCYTRLIYLLYTILLPERAAKSCDEYVCLSVCLSARITRKPHRWISPVFFHACCLWPWLGPPLTALRYVMCFRFYGWRHFGEDMLKILSFYSFFVIINQRHAVSLHQSETVS